jgi:Tim44-like domain
MKSPRFLLSLLIILIAVAEVSARVGGGGSYSGSSSSKSSSGGGSDSGFIIYLLLKLFELHVRAPVVALVIDAILIAIGVYIYMRRDRQKKDYSSRAAAYDTTVDTSVDRSDLTEKFNEWRKHDPNFSELLFEDFLHGLFANLHTARGKGNLNDYAPFANAWSRKYLKSLNSDDLADVEGIIVGSFQILDASDADDTLTATVRFEANYTERPKKGRGETYYVVEDWTVSRDRDVLSKPPGGITSNNCPKCGAGLQFTPERTCRYCLAQVEGGEYDWGVTSIESIARESRGPVLTEDVPDVGLDRPTIRHPNLQFELQKMKMRSGKFSEDRFLERVEYIFTELQAAWSDRDWDKARPYVTDRIYDSYHYWIDAYKRQNLWNVLDEIEINEIVIAKFVHDPFHDAITCRIYASMIDYVADENEKIVRGSKKKPMVFSEYWTFIRRKGVKDSKQENGNCPNCGAGLQISMAGVCEYCNSKITNGDFDWVLSRIEQDEAYQG